MGVLTASRAAIRAETDGAAAADQSRKSGIAQIATYIPSDVVATYVALEGIFPRGSETVKWILFGVGIALCIALPMLNLITSDMSTATGWGKQVVVIILAIVAFTAYAMAIPGSAFASLVPEATRWGAASALVLALIMPFIADAFGIKPTPNAKDAA
jgi:hypothetical protein